MDLNRAVTFVRVVEAGNFTRAAEALQLPPSSVSRSVAKLEEDLGVVLLERTTRRVTLTDAGRAYFERAREALAGLEQANSLAIDAATEPQGTVRLAVPPEIGAALTTPLAQFLVDHEKLRVELTFTNHGAELVGDLVDLAVTLGRLPDSSLIARRVGNSLGKLYAAPSYLARRGTPAGPDDLAQHDAILARAFAGEARWELDGPQGAISVAVRGRLVGEGLFFTTDAAAAGAGIALLPAWVGERLVARGELAALLPELSSEMPMHVVAPGSRHLARRVVVVRDFLVQTMTARCTAHAKKEREGGPLGPEGKEGRCPGAAREDAC